MHQHQHFHRQRVVERAASPEISTIYVTATPTFTGVIGGYKTLTSDDGATSIRTTQMALNPSPPASSTKANSMVLGPPVQTQDDTDTDDTDSTTQTSDAPQTQSTQSADNVVITSDEPGASATSSRSYSSTTFATSRQHSSTTTSVSTSSTTDTAASTDSASDGMSTGGKAGLAIAIILVLGLFAVLALLFLKKKRQQREQLAQAENDEKKAYEQATAAQAITSTAPKAPRLSLRPMSRLAPDLMGGQRPKSRMSQGNMLATVSESRSEPMHAAGSSAQRPSHQESVGRDNPFTDPVNPFADPEKAAAAAAAGVVGGAVGSSRIAQSPFPATPSMAGPSSPPRDNAHELEDTRSVSPPTAPATPQPLQSQRQMVDPNVVLAGTPPAPSPTVATGPGPEAVHSNVYRILMDFRPTMDDELELRSGQLVRLLHEYDDGWALCIRLDRSQQGVVPRTCLAAKPSKPRPAQRARVNGPGPGPRRAGPSPTGYGNSSSPRINGHPGSAPGSPMPGAPRPGPIQSPAMSPALSMRNGPIVPPSPPGTFNQAPRPLSPGPRAQPQRSMSPGPYGARGPQPMDGIAQRRRSKSVSASHGANTPGPALVPAPLSLEPISPPVRTTSPGVAM